MVSKGGAQGVYHTETALFTREVKNKMGKYLDPWDVNIGNYIASLVDAINDILGESEKRTVVYEDDEYEGYPIEYASAPKLGEFIFPEGADDLHEIATMLEEELEEPPKDRDSRANKKDQKERTPLVWFAGDYLYIAFT